MNYKKIIFIFIFLFFIKHAHSMNNVQQSLAQKVVKYCNIVIKRNKKFIETNIANTNLRGSPPTFDIHLFHQNKINIFEQAKNNIETKLNGTLTSLLASIKQVVKINDVNIVTMLEINDIVLTSEEKQLIKTL